MKDNMKLVYVGVALVFAIGFGIFMYKRSTPDIQAAYNPKNGPPAYMQKGGGEAAYRNQMQGQGTGGSATAPGGAANQYPGRYDAAPPGPGRGGGSSYGSSTYSGGPR